MLWKYLRVMALMLALRACFSKLYASVRNDCELGQLFDWHFLTLNLSFSH